MRASGHFTQLRVKRLLAGAGALALSACGGGGGGMSFIPAPPVAPTPSPTPTPTPTATPTPLPAAEQVTILPQPPVGEFATAGVWTNLYAASSSEGGRFTAIAGTTSSQVNVRYTSAGTYEVQLPGEFYQQLVHRPDIVNPAPSDPFLTLSGPGWGRSITVQYGNSGYSYSSMLAWSRPDLDFGFTVDSGVVAFGVPTPAAAVPVSGTASYQGLVSGLTDAKTFDSASNSWLLLPAGGSVGLNFDFAAGSLSGQMALSINGGMNPISVGNYSFAQTVFARGSTSYSGKFDTNLPGFNFFNGSFTGPHAEETIGDWAVPFTLDGQNHQAIGAWIAKKP